MQILGIPLGLRIKIQNYLFSFVQRLYSNRSGSSSSLRFSSSSAEGRIDGDTMVFEGIDGDTMVFEGLDRTVTATATANANESWNLIDSPPNEGSSSEQGMIHDRDRDRDRDRSDAGTRTGTSTGTRIGTAVAAEYSSGLSLNLSLGLGECDFYDEDEINHECGANSCFSESR